MRDKGKAIEISEFNYSAASELPCRKHPNSSSVGICAHCLKDRLVKLVCSECGEQRLSSCSCSDVSSSSYRNSMEVGSVGRVSFLIENDQIPKPRREEQVIFLRRSTSSCVEVKKTNGFWRIKRLFRKRRSKGCADDKSELWVSDAMGVSRSRSLCSFRGAADEGMSDCALSSAKISDVTSGIFLEQLGFLNDSEPRFRGIDQFDRTYSVPNRSVFPAKESDFSAMDESAFIDLKLDLSAEVGFESVGGFANMATTGDSCRITMNDKRGGRTHKLWKWIFKYPPANKNKPK